MRLTKTQKEYRRKMNKLKKKGLVKNEYGQTIKPDKIKLNINWDGLFRFFIYLWIIYSLLDRFGVISFIKSVLFV